MPVNKDYTLMDTLVSAERREELEEKRLNLLRERGLYGRFDFEHPLDGPALAHIERIKGSLKDDDDDFALFQYANEVRALWKSSLRKSVTCLRFFDRREPFMRYPDKKPCAYIDDLSSYIDRYVGFESMLYGSSRHYRDHVIHMFRVWLLGLDILFQNGSAYMEALRIQDIEANFFEKLSVWTMAALTHDLGYPLEKAQEIVGRTRDMMASFVASPNVLMDVSFSGVQDSMNDFILRMAGSKMVRRGEGLYAARLQPKYYFKLMKSLERCSHGTISMLIVYKLLLYFLESDFSTNEDSLFSEEERRQFCIRREILRAVASHTCPDIYHLSMANVPFLLIVADDAQDWGRKSLNGLFQRSAVEYELGNIAVHFSERSHIYLNESFRVRKNTEACNRILASLWNQCTVYRRLFRDGQYSERRDFDFSKQSVVELALASMVRIVVDFHIRCDSDFRFSVCVKRTGNQAVDGLFGIDWLRSALPAALLVGEPQGPGADGCAQEACYSVTEMTV